MPTQYKLKIRQTSTAKEIYCPSRRQWVALTLEENVRQQFIHYLVTTLGYELGHISVEKAFTLEGEKSVRADIIIYDKNGTAKILVECKAPTVTLDIETGRQASKYNRHIQATYIVLTNGKVTITLHTTDFINYKSIENIPTP